MTSLTLHSDFPELLDNTAREQFTVCPQKFLWSTIRKIGPNPASVHLHAGGAYAAGLEVMRREFYDNGASPADALALGVEALIKYYGDFETPEGSNKSCERMVGALVAYADKYPLAEDFVKPLRLASGASAVEFTFAIPIPGTRHPVTGNPILYGGRFDMLAVFQDTPFGEDDKTTSQLGATWGNQWELNSQFTGYTWAAREYGFPVAGFIIRGQSILKGSYGFAQHIVYRPQWMVNRWLAQLQRDVAAMIRAWETSTFDYALGAACSAYGGCEFKRLCMSNEPENWLSGYYREKHWNPLAKDPEEGDAVKGAGK